MNAETAFALVRHALDAGRPANGYLITGPVRGAGTELAVKIVQRLFCSAAQKPCGACERCRKVAERLEPDVHWILPAGKSRQITAEQIRSELIAPVGETAFSGGWKVGVILWADCLNAASANAFLKTLEEPPDRTLFLLLTDEPQKLLPTIISRCQRLDLSAERMLPEPWYTSLLETLAGPAFGRPLERMVSASLLVEIMGQMRARAEELVTEESGQNPSAKEAAEEDENTYQARVSSRYREFLGEFIRMMLQWYRDLVVVKCGNPAVACFQKKLPVLQERAANLTLADAFYNLGAIEELATQLFDRNMKEDSVVAYAIDRLHHGVKAGA